MSEPSNTVWRSAAVPVWMVALSRLDEADEPLTAYTAVRREGAETGNNCRAYLDVLERHGLVERVVNTRYPRWRITPKGRKYLSEGVRDMNDFLRGEW